MSKPVKGNPKKDAAVKKWLEVTRKMFSNTTFRNLSQAILREVGRTCLKIAADAFYYADLRNEQGRGGLSAARKRN